MRSGLASILPFSYESGVLLVHGSSICIVAIVVAVQQSATTFIGKEEHMANAPNWHRGSK